MRPFWLPLLLMCLLNFPAHGGSKPPTILFRIHVQTTGEGLPSSEATTINLPPNGEQIEIRSLPEVTEQDLLDVKPDMTGNVRILFNHRGRINLDAVTAQNQGRILVVMINGYIVYAPTIDEEISNGELDIPHALNPQAIQLLQQVAAKNREEAGRLN